MNPVDSHGKLIKYMHHLVEDAARKVGIPMKKDVIASGGNTMHSLEIKDYGLSQEGNLVWHPWSRYNKEYESEEAFVKELAENIKSVHYFTYKTVYD